MPLPVAIFLGLFVLLFLYLILLGLRAGPRQISEVELSRAVVLRGATAAQPGRGWAALGSKTTAEGLDLRFDADDDPEAEASFFVDEREETKRGSFANRVTVRLGRELATHHVHTRGYVFRIRLRGTDPVVGRCVKIQMHVVGSAPLCGRVENDDDDDPAVGGWIEVESMEVLQVGR